MYTIPKKDRQEQKNNDDDDDEAEDRQKHRRRTVVHNLAWLSVVICSFIYQKRKHNKISTTQTITTNASTSSSLPLLNRSKQSDITLLIESLERRAELLSNYDFPRSNADSLHISTLYIKLLKRLQQEPASPIKKSSLFDLRSKFALFSINKTRTLLTLKRYTESLQYIARIVKMSGKKIPFPVWKQAKELKNVLMQHLQERKSNISKILKNINVQNKKLILLKDQERKKKLLELKEILRKQRSGEDKDASTRLTLKEKRAKQQALYQQKKQLQINQKIIISNKRKKKSKLKSIGMFLLTNYFLYPSPTYICSLLCTSFFFSYLKHSLYKKNVKKNNRKKNEENNDKKCTFK